MWVNALILPWEGPPRDWKKSVVDDIHASYIYNEKGWLGLAEANAEEKKEEEGPPFQEGEEEKNILKFMPISLRR